MYELVTKLENSKNSPTLHPSTWYRHNATFTSSVPSFTLTFYTWTSVPLTCTARIISSEITRPFIDTKALLASWTVMILAGAGFAIAFAVNSTSSGTAKAEVFMTLVTAVTTNCWMRVGSVYVVR